MTVFSLTPLIIAGPTASGKSGLALALAQRYRGEIVCADSRQFYVGMKIGTACPSEEEMRLVPHHGYGIVDPLTQKFDAGAFVAFALKVIGEIKSRGKRAIFVGGTGLYLRLLYFGLGDVPKADPSVAQALAARVQSEGLASLYAELMLVDPASATRIKSTDRYRIIRALEIYAVTGERASLLRQSFTHKAPQLVAHWVYKKPVKALLMQSIGDRVATMFNNGLVDEACMLRKTLPQDHWALGVMGYKEALLYHDGIISRAEAESKTALRHRHYAKRQFTWFNKESFYRWIIS